jgi:hypothetical protein
MIRITISAEAYTFMAATLPGNIGIERQRAQNGDVCIWLDPIVLAKLKALRGRGMDRCARFSPGEGAAPDGRQLRGCGRACAG